MNEQPTPSLEPMRVSRPRGVDPGHDQNDDAPPGDAQKDTADGGTASAATISISTAALRTGASADRLQRVSRIIREERGLIIERWARVADDAFARSDGISRQELLDDLPLVLEHIGHDLCHWTGETASRVWTTAALHGEVRWRQGWDLESVVRDYQLLRGVLTEHLCERLEHSREMPLTRVESRLLHKVLDEAIAASVETYSGYKDAQLKAANAELETRVRERTAAIRELATLVTEAETRERERIAAMLHENLQQQLFAARIKIASLSGGIADEAMRDRLRSVQDLLEQSIEMARSLSVDLSPPALANGLIASLQWLVAHCAEQFEFEARCEIELAPDDLSAMCEAERVLLFRFGQEALLNAAKHSGGSQVTLRLSRTEDGICLTAIDNGRGGGRLAAAAAGQQLGYGLTDLRRRTELLCGVFDICRDEDSEGACVRITLPGGVLSDLSMLDVGPCRPPDADAGEPADG